MTNLPKKQKRKSPLSGIKDYYPVFLAVTGRRCIIIGGGKVAERKALPLIRAGAEVTVISPEISPLLETYRDKQLIRHVKRGYRRGDIKSAFLAIAATDSEEANSIIAIDAIDYNALLNVVDNPSLCSFIVPSVVRRNPLTIAISTGGVSPALAKNIRKELEAAYGVVFSKYLGFLRKIRLRALNEIPDRKKRERFLKEIVSGKIIAILKREGFARAKKEALRKWDEKGN